MKTYFAPAERLSKKELKEKIEAIGRNPVIDSLMKTVSGFLAVLDEHRQIMAVNYTFLKFLGINDPYKVFGLRLGEAINCIHARKEPGGCGTSKFCSTCGAAIAIIACLEKRQPAERICAATVWKNRKRIELCFRVRSYPVRFEEDQFLLLFLEDITNQHRLAALENTFFHDINNILHVLVGTVDLLEEKDSKYDRQLIGRIKQSVFRLKKEVEMQQVLSQTDLRNCQPVPNNVSLKQVTKELKEFFSGHPAARERSLSLPKKVSSLSLTTDYSLLLRVLTNMLLNAFESTKAGGKVKLWIEAKKNRVSFCVWNKAPIPQDVRRRIFQRHFTTKEGAGRGIGTYAIKLFGEQFLNGKVTFKTSKAEGTVFRLTLPASPPARR